MYLEWLAMFLECLVCNVSGGQPWLMEWFAMFLIVICLVACGFYCGHSRVGPREKAPNTLGYSRGGPRERGAAALGLKLE